jgi:hypothetical protein
MLIIKFRRATMRSGPQATLVSAIDLMLCFSDSSPSITAHPDHPASVRKATRFLASLLALPRWDPGGIIIVVDDINLVESLTDL